MPIQFDSTQEKKTVTVKLPMQNHEDFQMAQSRAIKAGLGKVNLSKTLTSVIVELTKEINKLCEEQEKKAEKERKSSNDNPEA